jgi:hypothetical protein
VDLLLIWATWMLLWYIPNAARHVCAPIFATKCIKMTQVGKGLLYIVPSWVYFLCAFYLLCIISMMLQSRHMHVTFVDNMCCASRWYTATRKRFVRLPHGFVSAQHLECLGIRPKMPHAEICTEPSPQTLVRKNDTTRIGLRWSYRGFASGEQED